MTASDLQVKREPPSEEPEKKDEKDGEGGEVQPPQAKRKRASRWSKEKCFVPGMPTILPTNFDEEKREAYLRKPTFSLHYLCHFISPCISVRLGIEECSRQLREGTYKRPRTDSDGSLSPEPTYDQWGVRTNTREVRKKRELEQRRHENVQALLKLDPNYRPPPDYK